MGAAEAETSRLFVTIMDQTPKTLAPTIPIMQVNNIY